MCYGIVVAYAGVEKMPNRLATSKDCELVSLMYSLSTKCAGIEISFMNKATQAALAASCDNEFTLFRSRGQSDMYERDPRM